jgi:hypothetical protein
MKEGTLNRALSHLFLLKHKTLRCRIIGGEENVWAKEGVINSSL